MIQTLIGFIAKYGVEVFPHATGGILINMDGLIFYEVAMEKRNDDAYLVTGNQKHYPVRDFPIPRLLCYNSCKRETSRNHGIIPVGIAGDTVFMNRYNKQ